jgi:hypothetical protein
LFWLLISLSTVRTAAWIFLVTYGKTAFHKNATCGSAGVGVLVKESILETFDIFIIDSEIEFKSKLSELSLLLAVCYLPPAESCRALDSELYIQIY